MRRTASVAAALIALAVAGVLLGAGPSRRSDGTYLVRAIFDDAAFAVPGETVRIAGAPVGTIQAVGVTRDKKAAVTLSIGNHDFVPFHANATCRIRPQSLIAERYVDCRPGTAAAPALSRISRGDGAGDYLLPVTQTSTAIDPDIVQDISQEPLRERLSIILGELGTGLAARGSDLNAVIHRADPALGDTDRVFQILARQNRVLAQLASDGAAVLGPLARARSRIADFVVQANTTAVASAARAADISRSFQLLPSFLRRLRPLMAGLGQLADQGTPLMASLGQSATAVDRQFANLAPFARSARTALVALGRSAQRSQPSLVATEPLAQRLKRLGADAVPASSLLDRLTASLDQTGAIEQLMGVLYYGTGATNGFDADGHYVRSEPLVGSCTAYSKTPISGCSANFGAAAAAASARAATAGASTRLAAAAARSTAGAARDATLTGLLRYLIGSRR